MFVAPTKRRCASTSACTSAPTLCSQTHRLPLKPRAAARRGRCGARAVSRAAAPACPARFRPVARADAAIGPRRSACARPTKLEEIERIEGTGHTRTRHRASRNWRRAGCCQLPSVCHHPTERRTDNHAPAYRRRARPGAWSAAGLHTSSDQSDISTSRSTHPSSVTMEMGDTRQAVDGTELARRRQCHARILRDSMLRR